VGGILAQSALGKMHSKTPKSPYLYPNSFMEKISETILKFLKLDSLIQNLTGFVETRIELMKIEIREDVAKAIARGLMIVVFLFLGFLFLIFFNIGLAHLFNTMFDHTYVGYWLVAGIYATVFLILLIFRKGIFEYFQKQMTEMMKRKEK
jgi:uncharacterized membrane protein YqjE